MSRANEFRRKHCSVCYVVKIRETRNGVAIKFICLHTIILASKAPVDVLILSVIRLAQYFQKQNVYFKKLVVQK